MQENKVWRNFFPSTDRAAPQLQDSVSCICSVQVFWCTARNFIFINYLNLPTQPDLIDLPSLHAYKLFGADSKFRQSDQMNSDTVLLITLSAAFKRLKRWEELMWCDWLLGYYTFRYNTSEQWGVLGCSSPTICSTLCPQWTWLSYVFQPSVSLKTNVFWVNAFYSAPPDMRHIDLKRLSLSLWFFQLKHVKLWLLPNTTQWTLMENDCCV